MKEEKERGGKGRGYWKWNGKGRKGKGRIGEREDRKGKGGQRKMVHLLGKNLKNANLMKFYTLGVLR